MRFLALFFLISLNTSQSFATELAKPKGEVILTISGNIENSNSERGAEFDLAMLEAMEATTITTNTPWTDAGTTFTGVRISVLLNTVGAGSSSFRASAFDEYWYDISNVDFEQYPIIVAYKRDKGYMDTRNLGPLWIMFPFDEFPELLTEKNKAASVWNLELLTIQ